MPLTLAHLRRFAIARSLFDPTTLKRAIHRMGFVQADPIRAPARAQDLILRHRVKDYRAGDLERLYAKIGVEEDFFIVYGFMTKSLQALMHPRTDAGFPVGGREPWSAERRKQAELLLEFVNKSGAVHPREVDRHFSHGTVKNYWGGESNATTHLLAAMHYLGMLRVARRESGIRIYAPLPGASLADLVRRLRLAVPQWDMHLKGALQRARQRLSHTRIDGVDWFWPSAEDAAGHAAPGTVRLLAPFDPVVWDRGRFELLWGWGYRFEAYTPAPKRKLGYYALPLLWRDRVIGWGNLTVKNGELRSEFGYIEAPPRDRTFRRELDAELDRTRNFLTVNGHE